MKATTGKKKKRKGSVARTAKAAYIVSTFGRAQRMNRAQGAAVELAVDHLIQGKRWRLEGKATKKRLRPKRSRAIVRKYAKFMLKDARRYAGPYSVAVSGDSVHVGEVTTLRATVKSATGAPMPNVEVQFTALGRGAGVATTDNMGAAAVTYTPGEAGYADIGATVMGLPDSALRIVRAAKPARATRLAIAVAKSRPRAASGRVAVSGVQRVTVLPPSLARAGANVRITPRLRYDQSTPGGSTQSATASLFGPYNTESLARQACTTNPKATATVTGDVAVGGEIDAPSLPVPVEGWYAVGVTVGGNEVNAPASSCGAVHKDMREATITPYLQAGSPYDVPMPNCNPGIPDSCGTTTYVDVTLVYDIDNLPLNYAGALQVLYTTASEGNVAPCPSSTTPDSTDGGSVAVTDPGRYIVTTQLALGGSASSFINSAQFRGFLTPNEFLVPGDPSASSCGKQNLHPMTKRSTS